MNQMLQKQLNEVKEQKTLYETKLREVERRLLDAESDKSEVVKGLELKLKGFEENVKQRP